MAKVKNPIIIIKTDEKFTSLVDRSITTVTAEDLVGVTVIGTNAFYNCASLVSVVLPNSVTQLANGAFQDCPNMTSIVIPNSVTSFGIYCLRNNKITSVNIPEGTTTIPYGMLNYVDRLLTLTIPSTVVSIGSYAFAGCRSLTSITVLATTPPTLDSDIAFSNTNNCPIYVPAASMNAYKAATNWASLASRIQAIP